MMINFLQALECLEVPSIENGTAGQFQVLVITMSVMMLMRFMMMMKMVIVIPAKMLMMMALPYIVPGIDHRSHEGVPFP